jgi:hypothetical protein
MTKSVSHFLQRRRPARNCLTANMDDPVQLRPRNSRRYVIYFARQQSNNLSIGQIISFFDRQSPLSKPSCLDLPIYRAVPRTAHHSSQSASLPTWTIPSTQAIKPPADTSAPRSVTHQEHLAPGRITPQNLRIDRRLPAGRMRWSISQLLLRKHLISFVSVHLPMRQNRGCVDI